MQVYNYDPTTFEYLGESSAFESPLEPGKYLVPANATTTPAPTYNAATQQCYWMNGAWTVSPIVATPVPPQPTAAQLAAAAWAAYQASAQLMLDKSDRTVLRCVENGVAVPAVWTTYRKALRAIISSASGDPTQPLPAAPAYPAGT